MTSDTPLTALAETGLLRVNEKAPAVTVIEAELAVANPVVPLRKETDAALALHTALTPVKFTADTWYSRGVVGGRVRDGDAVGVTGGDHRVVRAERTGTETAECRSRGTHDSSDGHTGKHRDEGRLEEAHEMDSFLDSWVGQVDSGRLNTQDHVSSPSPESLRLVPPTAGITLQKGGSRRRGRCKADEMRIEPFTLSGRHVHLAPLNQAHAPVLQAAADRDRSSYGHTVVPGDLDAMREYVAGLRQDAERDVALPFVQLRAGDRSPVGCTRFMNLVWWPGRDTPAEVEIGGTWLAADAQRSPINTEAKLLLLTQAFETWEVFRVALCTDALNQRSRIAIERIGASFEGILRRHRPSAGQFGKPSEARDSAMFSITDHEWPEVREGLRRKLDG